MKTFLLKNDKKRIYFKNHERISAEEELKRKLFYMQNARIPLRSC